MANGITYPKSLRDLATEKNRDLFAFGFDGRGGKMTVHCSMERGEAAKLALFCLKVTQGMTPKAAFEIAFK